MITQRNKFITDRSNGIGASEVAAVLGISKWATPYKLWLVKTGREPEQEQNVFTVSGNMLEDAVANWFESTSGHRLIKKTKTAYTVYHPTHDFIFCSPDREYFDRDGGRAVLECKTTQKSIDKDDIPIEWFTQLQFQMGILGLKKGSVAWLTRGLEFDYKEFDFAPEFFEQMIDKVISWWTTHILLGIAPEAETSGDVEMMFPDGSTPRVIDASDDMQALYVEMLELDSAVKEFTGKLDEKKEQIKLAMADASRADYAGITLFTWKTSKASVKVDDKKLMEQFPEAYRTCSYEAKAARPFLIKK